MVDDPGGIGGQAVNLVVEGSNPFILPKALVDEGLTSVSGSCYCGHSTTAEGLGSRSRSSRRRGN